MCPIDPTPHAGEVMQPREREFPQPKPGPHGHVPAPDIRNRPSLPDDPEQMAVDVEDEDADPVIDSGPGIADGPR